MIKEKFEVDEECSSCDGTGLYIGIAEKDGFAIVCNRCGGTGKYHFIHEYIKFTKRKDSIHVKRVLETNPGICVGLDIKNKLTLESFGGMPFKEWELGLPFPKGSEMREYTCPSWWYQAANYKLKPKWKECLICGSFSSCRYFGNKKACWARFDEGHKYYKLKEGEKI